MQGGKLIILKFTSQLLWQSDSQKSTLGFRTPASGKGMETSEAADDDGSFSVWNVGSRMETTDSIKLLVGLNFMMSQ